MKTSILALTFFTAIAGAQTTFADEIAHNNVGASIGGCASAGGTGGSASSMAGPDRNQLSYHDLFNPPPVYYTDKDGVSVTGYRDEPGKIDRNWGAENVVVKITDENGTSYIAQTSAKDNSDCFRKADNFLSVLPNATTVELSCLGDWGHANFNAICTEDEQEGNFIPDDGINHLPANALLNCKLI